MIHSYRQEPDKYIISENCFEILIVAHIIRTPLTKYARAPSPLLTVLNRRILITHEPNVEEKETCYDYPKHTRKYVRRHNKELHAVRHAVAL